MLHLQGCPLPHRDVGRTTTRFPTTTPELLTNVVNQSQPNIVLTPGPATPPVRSQYTVKAAGHGLNSTYDHTNGYTARGRGENAQRGAQHCQDPGSADEATFGIAQCMFFKPFKI